MLEITHKTQHKSNKHTQNTAKRYKTTQNIENIQQMLQNRARLSISWKILRNLVLAAHAKKGPHKTETRLQFDLFGALLAHPPKYGPQKSNKTTQNLAKPRQNQPKAWKTQQMLQNRARLSISWKILRNLVLAAHAKKGPHKTGTKLQFDLFLGFAGPPQKKKKQMAHKSQTKPPKTQQNPDKTSQNLGKPSKCCKIVQDYRYLGKS